MCVQFRIFERVGVEPWEANTPRDEKRSLRSGWRWPSPMPRDLFRPTYPSTDYQWVLLSHAGTGSGLHHDPHLTDAWNALITGYKVMSKI